MKLFLKKYKQKTAAQIKRFLNHINIQKLSEDKAKLCELDLSKEDFQDSLKNMQNDKSPGNDGLTKEFFNKKKPF